MKDGETILSLAVSNSYSLRTTVPIHVARQLELEKGDRMVWDLYKEDGKWIAKIRKKE